MPSTPIALAVLILVLSTSGCTCGKKDAPTKDEPFPPSAHHTGRMADQPEPWPGPPTWRDSFDDRWFELVKEGSELDLFRIDDTLLYAASHPTLYEIRSSPDGQQLTELKLPLPSEDWRVERIWTDEGCSPCVQLDKSRHYTNPSEEACRYARAGDDWRSVSYEPRPTPPPPRPDTQLKWNQDRTLLIDENDKPRWKQDAGAPIPTVPDYSKKCKELWKYLSGISTATAVDGDTVYMAVGRCGPNGSSVIRFDDDVGRFLPPLPHPKTLTADLHLAKDGKLFFVARCNRSHEAYRDSCVSVFNGTTWSDEGQQLDGIGTGAHAFASDDTLWILVAQGGTGRGGASPHAPTPAGTLHRRSPDGTWQQLAFPRHELPTWKLLRFEPLQIALVEDRPWISGNWYYVRKPDDDTLQTRIHGALFRWKPPTSP